MKKIMIGVVLLAVLLMASLLYVWSNLDAIVKDAIQTFGSEAVKTTVSVSEVSLQLEDGKASISGLTVANPDGFSDPNIFSLGNISVKIDIASINENPIIIDEIIISAPSVVYEINKDGISNADVLKKNLADNGGKSSESSADSGDALKMIIRKLTIEDSKAKVKIAALGGAEQSINLPSIRLTDIGKKDGGATAAEVAQILSSKLLGNVKNSVAKLGVGKYLGKSADAIKNSVGNVGAVAEDAGSAIKGMFGK